jgi:hypothetical protein
MVEETNASATEMHPDDATIATHSLTTRNPAGPSQVSPPQPLILRPGANSSDYSSQMAYDATNRVEAPNYGTQIPQNPNMGSTYASNYPQQSGSGYPDMGTRASGTYGGGGYPTNAQGPYQQPYAQQTSKMRFTALILVLVGILLLLIAVILFVIQRTNPTAGTTPASTPTAIISTTSIPTLSDTQSGQQIIQEYYEDINKQNYQGAYNLWKTPQQSFAQFRSGFQHTKHDDVSFGNVTQQPDGSVKVTVTVSATEETQQSGTQQSTYTGYYMTGKQNNNAWKITAAVLEKQ